jgi:hypothetical protein
MNEFHFPNWVNRLVVILIVGFLVVGGYLATCIFAAILPSSVNVGHAPIQPVPYSHKLHAGKLKLDCRYCHNTVEEMAGAAVPATATCGNCHGGNRVKENATLGIIFPDSDKLQPIRQSLETKDPVMWIKVHDLPDFVYFNHSAHINRGVSCVSCHGRVDKMDVVTQVESLSMKWCLDCHRDPSANVRPVDLVTTLDWNPSNEELQKLFAENAERDFAKLDTDGDGSLNYEEAGRFVAQANAVDANRDEIITPNELTSPNVEVDRAALGRLLLTISGAHPSTNCSTCHR